MVPLREGWETSSITTTLVAASVTNAMPATIVEVFDKGFHPSTSLTWCRRQAISADPVYGRTMLMSS